MRKKKKNPDKDLAAPIEYDFDGELELIASLEHSDQLLHAESEGVVMAYGCSRTEPIFYD